MRAYTINNSFFLPKNGTTVNENQSVKRECLDVTQKLNDIG